jgi:sialate O-acetylesterase
MLKTMLFFSFLGMAALAAPAQDLRLPSLLSDHMVLQQGVPQKIWGWAAPGQEVRVSLGHASATAKADAKGHFEAGLPPLPAGGPWDLSVSAGSLQVVHDVLVGEVWLGSGQSNMEFATTNSDDASKEIPLALDPQLRLFQVDRHSAASPQDELQGHWMLCTPDTVAAFSAVAYHFGKNLRAQLHTPVGIIANAWGGSPAEAWTPREALEAVPELAQKAKSMESDASQVETWTQGLNFEVELKDLKALDADGKELQAWPALSADKWFHSEKPGSKVDLAPQAGSAKFSGNVEGGGWASLSLAPGGQGHTVDLSKVQSLEFKVRGKGSLSTLLHQGGEKDWDDYGSEPLDMTQDWKTVRIQIKDLKQGGWGARRQFKPGDIEAVNFALRIPYWPELPSLIYNAEVAPLTRYPIKGVIWYQGEANAGRASQYKALLEALIQGWRSAWGIGDFPFLIVQLPNYADGGGSWAALREAQAGAAEALPNSGYVCTIDLGDAHNIHPHRKSEVARRLSRLALAKYYGIKQEKGGPVAEELHRSKDILTVGFKDVGSGMLLKDGVQGGFEVAGVDGAFHAAKPKLVGRDLQLSSAEVAEPVEARYAWSDDPQVSLFSKDGLPASPFHLALQAQAARP